MKDPRVYLFEIGQFAREVKAFTSGSDFSGFAGNKQAIRAVSYCLLAIGEATYRLEKDFPGFLQAYVSAEVPWQQIVGIRNFLAHGYDRIDPGTLWQVAQTELDALIEAVELALEHLKDVE